MLYRKWWNEVPEMQLDPNYKPQTKVSVIIPARDEEDNIGNLLDDIFAQKYPRHLIEVIVIDDDSRDKTSSIAMNHGDAYVYFLPDFLPPGETNSYKKRAIELGVYKSTGELVISTDADCRMCEYWLLSMVQHYESQNKVMLAGPVAYHKSKSILGIFQELDFMSMQGITGAILGSQKGAMCNGANLAYTVDSFDAVGGFIDADEVASGDDMMLMHKVQQHFPKGTAYVKTKDAIVYTDGAPTLKAFVNQRIRWASKSSSLADLRIIMVLVFVFLVNFMLLYLLIKGVYNSEYFLGALGLYVLKASAETIFLWPVAGFFDRRSILWWLYPLQLCHVLYMIFVGILGQLKHYHWKGRRVQ